uniref:Phosphatidylglycerophosphatase and protein-tyrosine phosphatase 1 n=2 Tax=Bos mutus grunniens TaxID=30521 RepID=A0A8B9Y9Z9_BOSMU
MWGCGGKGRTNPGPLFDQAPLLTIPSALSSGLPGREPLPGPVPPFGGVTVPSVWRVVGEGAPGSLAGVTVPPAGVRAPTPTGVTAPPSGGGGSLATGRGHSSPHAVDSQPRVHGTGPPSARGPLSRPEALVPPLAAGGPSSRAMVWVPGAPGGPGDSPGAGPEVATLERPAPAGSSSLEAAAASPPPWPGPRSPASCPAVGGSPLRRAGWAGMAAGTLLEAGLARVLYYPTLLYTVFRGKMPGRAHRDWYHRIDSTVLLGALPLRSMTRRLVQDENVRGVITMNEEYETRFLCNSSKEWEKAGVEQLRLSTVDMTGVPTLANLQKGVRFTIRHQSLGHSVYVHCKAGRSRSATMVAAYLIQVYHWTPEEAIRAITKIRSHIYIRPGQLEVLKEFHKVTTAGAAKTEIHHTPLT